MSRLLQLLGLRCGHWNTSFPQRNKADGRDYQTCLDCGASVLSAVQFGPVCMQTDERKDQ
jgi:hypothetical protein